MRDFRLCVAFRTSDGVLDEPVHEEVITACDPAEAITRAKAIELDLTALKANALYLVDSACHVLWSLRLADAAPARS